MAKKIALAVLTVALVGAWGVLPAMALHVVGHTEQAAELGKTNALLSEAKALLSEAKELLSEAKEKTGGDAVRKGNTASDLAKEIAAVPSL
jgi:hypothetical protein